MYTIPYSLKAKDISSRDLNRKIPYTIVQTMRCNQVPYRMLKATQTWTINNPDYDYEFFDNERCKKFILENYDKNILTKFMVINTGAGKADFFRWLYLYKKGGVYSDIDTLCKIGLTKSELIEPDDNFISKFSNDYQTRINHHVLMASKGNMLLKRAIDKVIENINHLYLQGQDEKITQDLCGPGVLYKEYNKLIGVAIDLPHRCQKLIMKIKDEKYKFLQRHIVLRFCTPKYKGYHEDQQCLKNTHYTQKLAYSYDKCTKYLLENNIDINGENKS